MKATALCFLCFVVSVAAAAPARAQDDSVSVKAFGLVTSEHFAAKKTFDAVFGKPSQIFAGGGLEFGTLDNWYLDVAISRFSKTGQRAFVSNGQTFELGIPVTATLVPIEATLGYRFRVHDSDRFRPYVGAGSGLYLYKESSPASVSDSSDNVSVHHIGFLGVAGVQVRVQTWVSLSADAQYTTISGILGKGGISQQVNENDLGGIAGRFRILIGK